jgi:hypothetical protein
MIEIHDNVLAADTIVIMRSTPLIDYVRVYQKQDASP